MNGLRHHFMHELQNLEYVELDKPWFLEKINDQELLRVALCLTNMLI